MNIKTASIDGQVVGVVANNSISYLETVFNELANGCIVVPLRNEQDHERIEATGIEHIRVPDSTKGWFKLDYPSCSTEKLAQISFTSGTEGKPKGVLLSHSALDNTIDRLISLSNIDDSAREYIGIPVYHSFGYGRCRLLSRVGGQGYIPHEGFNPIEFSKMLKAGEVNALSAVPSLLRLVLTNQTLFGDERHALRWIEIGSQPMSGEEKAALRTLFPKANIIQHYGLTEASRSSLLDIQNASEQQLDSVGRGYADTEFMINDDGCIKIRGAHLASGLLIDGEITDIADDDGWFTTSDLGELNDGYLHFKGRADNTINCGGQKITAEQIEADILAEFDLDGGVAASRGAHPVYGEVPFIFIEKRIKISEDQMKSFLDSALRNRGLSASNVVNIVSVDHLPMTDTGKVQRKTLSAEVRKIQENQKPDIEQIEPSTPMEALKQHFHKTTGILPTDQDSIDSLGLDSIQAVAIFVYVETQFGHIPTDIRTLSISDIAALPQKETRDEATEPVSAPTVLGSRNENPKDISFWALIKEDFVTHERDWTSQGFWAVANHRFGNWRMSVRPKLLRFPLTLLYKAHLQSVQMFCGVKLDYTVKLGRRVKLEHFGGIIVGARSIGDDVTIRQNTTFGIKDLSDLKAKPTIENGVNIGTGAVVVGDITIGRYSVIGPNAVVDEDVPAFSTVSVAKPSIKTN